MNWAPITFLPQAPAAPRVALDVEGIILLLTRYGYLIVFLAALAEALPLLGWLVPGQAVIIIAGAVAAAGYLDITTLILITIPAGIIGDGLGYHLGRRYGRAFLEKYGKKLRIGPRHLERSELLFAKYGPFALVVARFSFLTRAVGPILAGMARMRARVFWPVNVIGAIAWSVAYGVLGYSFGVSFLYLQGTIGKILSWTLVAVVALYLFYRFLKKYASQFTRDDLYIALMGVGAGAAFGILADRVQKLGAQNALDATAPAFVALLAPLARFFDVLETLTSFAVLGAVSLLLLAYFFVRRRWWDATLVGAGMGGIILLVETLRPIFAAVLPAGPGDSFPSAAAAIPLVLAGIVTYLVSSHASRARAIATGVVGAALAGVAAFARVAQGVEYPSSAFAGLALGGAWLSVTLLIVEFRLKGGRLPGQREPGG